MINVLIVDDEKPSRDELVFLLSEMEEINVIGQAEDGLEALRLISRKNPDIVFLDIQMPEMSGIELAEYLQKLERKPYIIFTTAYNDFAIQAFDVGAFDYLLKPFEKERLAVSLKRFREIRNAPFKNLPGKKPKQISRYNRTAPHASSFHILVVNGDNYFPVKPADISVIAASGRKSRIITESHEYEDRKTLSYFEELLKEYNFFKTHRSYLINPDHIEKIGFWFNNTYQLTMDFYDETVPVSRSKVHEFRTFMSIE